MQRTLWVSLLVGALVAADCMAAEIHDAARAGDGAKVTQLLDQGADVNARDETGMTPLRLACRAGRADLVRLLLDRRASPDLADNNGEVPLHTAARRDDLGIIQMLLGAKAAVDAKDNWGTTPLQAAAEANCPDAVALLVARGANTQVQRTDGKTLLDIAGARVRLCLTMMAQIAPPLSAALPTAPPLSPTSSTSGLEGLTEAHVVVEDIGDSARQRTGLSQDGLRTRLEAALIRSKTVRVREEKGAAGKPFFYLNVAVLPLDDRQTCVYSVLLELKQTAVVEPSGRNLLCFGATTWDKGNTGIAPDGRVWDTVRKLIEEAVDALTVDWTKANPPKE
jgi:uncharacterized protein